MQSDTIELIVHGSCIHAQVACAFADNPFGCTFSELLTLVAFCFTPVSSLFSSLSNVSLMKGGHTLHDRGRQLGASMPSSPPWSRAEAIPSWAIRKPRLDIAEEMVTSPPAPVYCTPIHAVVIAAGVTAGSSYLLGRSE